MYENLISSLWPYIQNSIDTELEIFATQNYKKLDTKLHNLLTKQQKLPDTKETFSSRVINNTDIELSEDEITLLNKGLKYNLSFKNKNWIRNLALEAGTAINYLPETEREWKTAEFIDTLYIYHTHNIDYKGEKEINLLTNVKKKLSDKSAMITQSDKGNSIVIIKTTDITKKSQTLSP